ncbi:hypothetical protein [Furfurilactobacillus entadae]|uniref:hypothetical protein n=1 Tax=Furfurilactobacillus entadae TaxID=2922307 RepID=UPI0035E7D847
MAKYNYEFKAKIVTEYLAGIGSTTLTHRYNIPNRQIIIDWVNKFQMYDVEGLEVTHRKQIYSSDFKQQV